MSRHVPFFFFFAKRPPSCLERVRGATACVLDVLSVCAQNQARVRLSAARQQRQYHVGSPRARRVVAFTGSVRATWPAPGQRKG